MNRVARFAVISFTILMLMTTVVANAYGGDEAEAPSWSPRAVANYLDQRTEWWLSWPRAARGQGTACLSCHGAVPYALAGRF